VRLNGEVQRLVKPLQRREDVRRYGIQPEQLAVENNACKRQDEMPGKYCTSTHAR